MGMMTQCRGPITTMKEGHTTHPQLHEPLLMGWITGGMMMSVEVAHTCADESMSVLTTTYLVVVKRTTKVVVLGKRSLIGKDKLQGFIYSVKRSYKRSLHV